MSWYAGRDVCGAVRPGDPGRAAHRETDAPGMVVAAVGTMHRKLEPAAARQAVGGREPLSSRVQAVEALLLS